MSGSPKQQKLDMAFLVSRPEFLRFMWRMIQRGHVLEPVSAGATGRDLSWFEGRRALALELLDDAETGMGDTHPEGAPLFVAIQIFREQANQAGTEELNATARSRSDEPAGDDRA